jgi:hypothetical protein
MAMLEKTEKATFERVQQPMQSPHTENAPPLPVAPSAHEGSTPTRSESSGGVANFGTGVGAFTTNLFVCMLTNAAADYKSDTSLKTLLSSLALPPPSQIDSAASNSTLLANTSNGAPSASPAFNIASSLIVCPATSPNALAITSYCQMWRSNAIWPCCSFVMIAPSVPVAAVYESTALLPSSSSTSTSHARISNTCPTTRAALLHQCICHLRSALSPILDALPSDQLLHLTTGTHGPFPPKLAGTRIRVTRSKPQITFHNFTNSFPTRAETVSAAISAACIPLSSTNPSRTFLAFAASTSALLPAAAADQRASRAAVAASPMRTPASTASARADESKARILIGTEGVADDKTVVATPSKSAKKSAVKSSAVETAAVAASLARPSE